MRRVLPILLILLLVSGATAGVQAASQGQDEQAAEAQAPRPMTVDDALDMVSVGGAQMSPDGAIKRRNGLASGTSSPRFLNDQANVLTPKTTMFRIRSSSTRSDLE